MRYVRDSLEFRRVRDLPRRIITPEEARADAARLTALYARPGKGAALREEQGGALGELARVRGLLAALPVGTGKAQPNDTPTLTPDGWRPIGDLAVGDRVIGSGGKPIAVLGVYPQGSRPLLRMVFSDGSAVLCDEQHLWTLEADDRGRSTRTAIDWATARLDRPCGAHRAKIWWLPRHPVVDGEWSPMPLDPYTLGALLGDGALGHTPAGFTSMDPDIVSALVLPEGVRLTPKRVQNSGRATDYYISTGRRGTVKNPLTEILRELGVHGCKSGDKFIPPVYMHGSVEQRLDLLRGLFDTDGSALPAGAVDYSSKSRRMIGEVVELVQSLGGTSNQPVAHHGSWRVYLTLPRAIVPFACARKREAFARTASTRQRDPRRALVRVERVEGKALCTCILVDSADHLYITEHYVLTHNTLVGELASRVLWPDAKQAPASLLVAGSSAGLRDKALSDRRSIRAEWRILDAPPSVTIAPALARESAARFLWETRPALIVLDEADDLANPESATCQRLRRYKEDFLAGEVVPNMRGAGVAELIFLIMSGTLSRSSIMGYHHLAWLALGDGMPLPESADEASSWALSIDHKGPRGAIGARPNPGPLGANVTAARAWFSKRLAETPGVYLVDKDSAEGVPFKIRWVKARECPVLDAAYEKLLTEGENPAGIPVTDPLAMWRTDMQLGCGYVSKWKDPQPPLDWRLAFRVFAGFCRRMIDASQGDGDPLDTPAQVVRAYPDAEPVIDWLEIAPTYKPVEEIVAVSDATLESVGDWLSELDSEPAIIWCGSVEFAERLAELSGLPYYSRNGREQRTGRPLHSANGTGRDRIVIVSWHANKKGFNLQAYGRQLFVYPPQSAKWLEQAFGRSHRAGRKNAVIVDFLITSGGTADAFEAAIGEAEFARETTRLTQKILRANIERLDLPSDKSASNAFRWARKRGSEPSVAQGAARLATAAKFPWRSATA